MAKRVGVDKWLFWATLVLVVIGLLMVFSASAVMAQGALRLAVCTLSSGSRSGQPWTGRDELLMQMDYRRYNKPNVVFPAVAVTVAAAAGCVSDARLAWRAPLDPLGRASFQPSEIAKPTLVLFLAWFLQNRMESIEDLPRDDPAGGAAEPDLYRADFERA